MTKVGIIGATGYAGVELVRLLQGHPKVELVALGSVSHTGSLLEELYPGLTGLVSLPLVTPEEVIEKSDVIFASLPHGFSEEIGSQVVGKEKKLIDLGADFRLSSEETYYRWYGKPFLFPELHQNVPYGLPELFRQDIQNQQIVANPGCYPTAAALGLAPVAVRPELSLKSIFIDAKSGVTGAGKGLTDQTHYPQCNENLAPYGIGTHRHTPEIEQTLSRLAGKELPVTFVPHLIPVNRGILETIYFQVEESPKLEELFQIYQKFYQEEPFIRLLPLGKTAQLRQVVGSNYCAISLHQDPHTGNFVVISVIDNMVKGAAGQAIQNMNLLCHWQETTGLGMIPTLF